MSSKVTMFAPGTIANLGPGFDILGLAIRGTGDRVSARRVEGSGVRIIRITGDRGKLPLDAASNTAGIAAASVLQRAGVDVGIELEIHKGMPIGSGLGSSAASAAAAAMATNRVLGSPLRRMELIGPCVDAESHVSGRHADNVAPALLGGLIMVRSVDPPAVTRLPVPPGLHVVVATPAFELPTRDARAALPAQVPLSAMIAQSVGVATLVAACYCGDLTLLGSCIRDPIVTPARISLIPGGAEVIDAAERSGALGASISGAGPSIFAFCHTPSVADRVGRAMVAAFSNAGLPATAIVSPADCPGAGEVFGDAPPEG